ncbi:YjgB family protein [Paenibacillus sp. P26]|nr:YjgB family protein [Paenibacillus sp. P26]UUZ94130.1 YjgB family protein [Paenibacillus sp. P25]
MDADFLSVAKNGSLKGIDIPLGTSRQDVIGKLGEPDEIGTVHTEFLRYGDTYFYIWGPAPVVGVIDTKITVPPAKIKEMLGQPDFDGMSEAGVAEYVVGYEVGSYYLYFKYKNPDAQEGILRFKNPRG